MELVQRILKFLTTGEKLLLLLSIIVRLVLVGLDLAGIFLVGVVVSLISGTVVAPTSQLAEVLSWLNSLGVDNGYAIILGFAVGFFVLKGLLSFLITFLTANYVGRIEAKKAKVAYEGIFQSPASDLGRFGKHDVLHGLTNSMNAAFGQTLTIGAGIVGEIGLLLAVAIYLAYINLSLFLILGCFFLAVGLLMQTTIGALASKYSKRQHDAFIRSQGTILDSISNYKQLAIGDPSGFVAKFGEDRAKSARSSAVYATLGTLPRFITEISVMIGVGLLVLQRSSSSSSITATTVAIFLAGIFRIVAAMLPLQNGFSLLKRIKHEAELAFRMLEVFGTSLTRDSLTPPKNEFPPAVSLTKVIFSYDGKGQAVLDEVSFEIPSGAYCALVGESGAGKTTLVDIILGLYRPDSGQVRIGDLAPEEYLTANPGAMGYVPQVTSLISGTLLENITMQPGVEAYDADRLSSAIRMANIEDLVSVIPDGLQAKIGPGGLGFSGGQAQRVGLARALYGKPRFLILDEATSALDDESERAIRDALEKLRGKTTIIVIAHRPSTLEAAEMVLWVRSKKVTSYDSYDSYKLGSGQFVEDRLE